MRALLFSTIALVGCTKQNPDFCPAHPDDPRCGGMGSDGGGSDGSGSDGPTTDARACVGTGDYHVCMQPPPPDQTILTPGITIDTMTSTLCTTAPAEWMAAGHPAACFIVGTLVNIPNVTIVGAKPVVFVSSGMITVSGIIDAASHSVAMTSGPGSNIGCGAYVDNPTPNASGGGGGAGGTFRTLGGNGGNGNGTSNTGGSALDPEPTAPTVLRAGCNGQEGAAGQDGGTSGGNPGAGGGAVVLIGASIGFTTGAGINVSGGAGLPGTGKYAGGGGGGSGGMIVLNAEMIAATGTVTLMANGGGGSGGNGNGGATAGNEPVLSAPTAVATGGGGQGGSGGSGFAGTIEAQPGGNGGGSAGGGGGGGGGGYIQVNQMSLTGFTTSPATTYVP